MKILILTFSIILIGGVLCAQDVNNDYSAQNRPDETEILLNQPGLPNSDTPISNNESNKTDNSNDKTSFPGIGIGDFIRMIVVLLVVIGLIYGFFWLLKRFSSIKPHGTELIRILSARPLKGDAALHLIETGNRIFLIGSTGNAVNLISEIDDKESKDEIQFAVSQKLPVAPGGFSRLFNRRLNSGREEKKSTLDMDEPATFIRNQRGRLQNL